MEIPTISASLCLYALTLIIITICIRQRYFSPLNSIPGPQLGTIGTFFQVWQVFKGRINQTLIKLHKKHGACVRISYNEVSISHPDATQVLAAPLHKAPFYSLMAVPNSSYNSLMSERDPTKYAVMRSNVASAFTLTNVIKNESVIDDVVKLLTQRLGDLSQRAEAFEIGEWLHFLTWDLLGEIMFSNRFGFLDQGRDVGGSIKNNFYLSLYITSMVYIQWLHSLLFGNPVLRWIDFQPTEHTYNTAVENVEKRKAHTDPRPDMMGHWLAQHRKHPTRFTEKNMFSNVTMTVGAGASTVGSALEAFFYLLLKEDSKYMGRLQAEIDNAHLSDVVTYAEAQQLPYLQAVVSR